MIIFKTFSEYNNYYKNIKHQKIGFVPTMGALHAGHISLCEKSLMDNETTVVSIFVNPTQFNNNVDFNNYPIDINQDLELLKQYNINAVFIPDQAEIYHDNYNYQITEKNYSNIMEGAHRPGHFTGMLTVVMKLLNIIKPNNLYLGEKDYQQALLIKNMIDAFFMDIEVKICATVRDSAGLALSSRNRLLSREHLETAKKLNGLIKSKKSLDCIKQDITNLGFELDYLEQHGERRFIAAKINNVRLIDNVVITS
jgi:pantoate--beta-alanine ligase